MHAEALVERLPPSDLIFLDSENLDSLDQLEKHCVDSANHLLLLTHKALERPWVLAELAMSQARGRCIHPIIVEWKGQADDDRVFRFPQDLHAAIADWKTYIQGRKQQVVQSGVVGHWQQQLQQRRGSAVVTDRFQERRLFQFFSTVAEAALALPGKLGRALRSSTSPACALSSHGSSTPANASPAVLGRKQRVSGYTQLRDEVSDTDMNGKELLSC